VPDLEALRRRIDSTTQLQSVVKTMKALAAVSIRQFERAAASLEQYHRTIEWGLHVALHSSAVLPSRDLKQTRKRTLVVVFGTDLGMSGRFNQAIVEHTFQTLEGDFSSKKMEKTFWAVGDRLPPLLANFRGLVERTIRTPSSVAGIAPAVEEVLVNLMEWRREEPQESIQLFYNRRAGAAAYRPTHFQLLPLDWEWLENLRTLRWPTRKLPIFSMDPQALMAAFLRETFYVSIYRSFAESLASENAARLSSMQAAEKNIEETLGTLQQEYNQKRQSAITEELMDIVSGFEALQGPARS